MPKFLNNIDLNQNQLQNAVIQPLGTAPNSGSEEEGQIYFDSTAGDKALYYWNDSAWVRIAGQVAAQTTDTIASGDFVSFSDESEDAGTEGVNISNKITIDNFITTAPALTTAGTIADGDSILFIDANDSNETKKEALADLVGVIAGTVTTTGLSDANSVLKLDIQNMTASTTIADADLVVIDDGAGGTLRKMTRANFIESAALDSINIDGGAIDGTAIGANVTAAGTFDAVIGTTGVFSGILKTDDTTDATSKTDGSLQTDGGLSVAKAIYNGTAATLAADSGVVTIGSTTAATFSAAGLLNINNATDATSGTDGSLQTDGGLSVVKDAVIGNDLILLSDAPVIHFGTNKEVTLTHVHNAGLTMTHTGTGDNLPMVLQLKSEENAIIVNEVISSLEFAAGDDSGSDAALVSAGIHAIAEETFAADANATKLVFTTADSETAASSATAKMTLASTGNLTTAGSVTAVGSFIIGSADMNEADLEKLDGITNGTVAASKAVVVDSNKDIGTFRNVTIDGTFSDGNYTFDTSGNVSGLGTVGCGAITSSGNLAVTGTITGDTSLTLDSTTISTAELGVLDGAGSDGVAQASKAIVMDGSKNVSAVGTFGCGAITSTGTSTIAAVNVTGVATAATFEPDGDTSSGDAAAIGYTSAEGLILTGQGSTSDVTLKNDADGTVFTVPTGTDDILFPDSAKGMWGAASDMTLYHDATNSYITNKTGALKIATETSGIAITIGHSTSEVTVADNLTVTGNLTVAGATTTVTSTTVATGDSLIELAKDQDDSADAVDFGIYGVYGSSNTPLYAGIFRDQDVSGDPWTFFDSLQAKPGTTVNVSGTGYDLADISAGGITAADGFTGDLTGKADTADALETARNINGVSFDGSANITVTAAGSTLSDTVTVAKGGTGQTSLDSNAVLVGNSTSGITSSTNLSFDDTDLTLASTGKMEFRDANSYIYSPTANDLEIVATDITLDAATVIELEANTNITGTCTASGILKTDDTTDATSTTDGSLQTDGGLSVAKDVIIGNDIYLLNDSAVLGFGAGKDVTLTHTNDVGVTLNSTMKLMFNDASQYIQGSSNANLDIAATTDVNIEATTLDVNAALDVSGTSTLLGAVTTGGGILSDTTNTDALGTSSVTWSDLYLGDGGIIYLGEDQDVTLTHVADTGLTLKHTATGDNKPIIFTLATGETDIAEDEVIGAINFQAPDEGTGTDAILVAAGIEAVSEGDFSSSSNATKLSFKTAASATAAETMSLSSGGNLTVSGSITSGSGSIALCTSWVLNDSVTDVEATSSTVYTITHGMGTDNAGRYGVEVISTSGDNLETVYVNVARPTTATITITFASAPTAGAYTALVTKFP